MKLSARMSQRNRGSQYKNIIVLLAIFSLSACANMTEGNRIRAEGTGIGAGGGAAIGAATCEENRAAGAVLGGVIGGTVGYFTGDWQANKIDRMGRRSSQREHVISNLQQYHAKMSSYTNRLEQQITQYEQNLRRGIRDVQGVRMNLKTARNKRNEIQSVINQQHRKGVPRNPNQRRFYENQLRQLQGDIQKLDNSIRRLQSLSGYGRVGY